MSPSHRTLFATTLIIVALFPASAFADAAESEVAIQRALRMRDYQQAIRLIDEAMADGAPDRAEFLQYRKGLAFYYLGEHRRAIEQFAAQLKSAPDGPWAVKARMRTADAHVALREFEAAEKIYAERVRTLIGSERKAELAGVYLKFADDYFEPTDSLSQPNYGQAGRFYALALELEPSEPLAEQLAYKVALCKLKAEDCNGAAGAFDVYLKKYDPAYRDQLVRINASIALPPLVKTKDAKLLDARLGLGEAHLRRGDLTTARTVLKDLVGLMEQGGDASRHALWPEAVFLLSRTYQMPEPPDAASLTSGVAALEPLIEKAPSTKQAIQAAHDVGHAYAHLGRGDEAIAAFRAFIGREGIRPEDDETRELAAKLSQDALFSIGRVLAAQRKFADAIGVWNEYVAKYPSGAHWADAQRAIVDAEYDIGAHAATEDRFDDARIAWNAFLQKYPLDDRVRQILFDFGRMSYDEQTKRKEKGDEPNWQAPIAEWRKLVGKFPGTEESGRAQYRIARTLERDIGDLEKAIEDYKKLDWSGYAARAQSRLAEMKSVRLAVETERVYRTTEPAKIDVDTRNIDKLTVKLYRIDMEDYFRKQHGLSGVDALDLMLIDPDKQFDVDVKDYSRYRPLTQEIEVPIDGPAVYAVNVCNEKSTVKNDDGGQTERLEATTLVVRSDIDILVRSTREQMLVFAQNMLEAAPAAGVRLLVTDGKKTMLEAVTGADGVWQSRDEKIKDTSAMTVLALRDGHVAGTHLSIRALTSAGGLTPRGYITTDRTAYQPGDAVNIRGVLRETGAGQYTLPSQPEDERLRWKLDVIDAKGRVLTTDEIAMTEFGTFASTYQVARDGPVGEYKIVARRPDGPTFTGAFLVQTYQLPKAFLSFDIPERVILRGRPIKGAVVAKYNYGEPVRDRDIEYVVFMPSGEQINRVGKTDADGRVEFEFESGALPEEGTVSLYARQADMGIEAGDQIFVAVRAFTASVETSRPLFLSDEPVEITVTTRDLKDKPLVQAMTVTALRKTRSRGQWAETKVSSEDVTTNADSGRGRVTMKLAKGGEYVIRAEGVDRLGNTVTAETRVEISDDKDQTRLRMFSEKQHYRVGETLVLDIHSRIMPEDMKPAAKKPPLGLITYEGDGFLSYAIESITPNHNEIQVNIDHQHFPNFRAVASVMGTRKLYEASRDFTVERKLTVSIKPDKSTYRPRDPMSVDIAVTDHQGKPVSAEIELTMIDNALLARYPDDTPNIVSFFQEGAKRVTSSQTRSSCTFHHDAATRPMVTEVLDEERRLAEAASRAETMEHLHAGAFDRGAGRARTPMSRAQPATDASAMAEDEDPTDVDVAASDEIAGRLGVFREAENAPEERATLGLPARKSASRRFRAAGKKIDGGEQFQGFTGGGGGGQYFEGHTNREGEDILFDSKSLYGYTIDGVSDDQPAALGPYAGDRFKFTDKFVTLNKLAFGQSGIVGQAVVDANLAAIVNTAPPRSYFPEVAYWNPRITTDADGKATATIIVPDSSTTWRLLARGVTAETLCGQATAEVTSKHDFFVELLTPDALVEGDSFQPIAQVHSLSDYSGDVEVTFRWQTGTEGEAKSATQTVTFEGAGVQPVTFDAIKATGTPLKLACSAATGDGAALSDVTQRDIPVELWGMRLEAHAAGTAEDSRVIDLTLPPGATHDKQLTISIGADVHRWLVDEALWSGPRWAGIESTYQSWRMAPPRTNADAASSLLGALYTANYVKGRLTPGTASDDARQLDERVNGLIAQLLAAQNDEGGWGWCGVRRESDPWTTGAIAWALGKAHDDGYLVAEPARRALTEYLRKQFAESHTSQTELKAVVLHGLSWIDAVDFSHANRLFRMRESLSTSALGHLALTFLRVDRRSMALETLEAIRLRSQTRELETRECRVVPTEGNSAWMQSELELTALTLLAQLQADPTHDSVPEMVAYLTGSARAEGWRPHKARGAVIAALATFYARGERERADYSLVVKVNGNKIREISSRRDGSIWFDVAPTALTDGAQKIALEYNGRGAYTYAVTLSGFTNEFPDPAKIKHPAGWVSERRIRPEPPEFDGRPINPGWTVAREYGRKGHFYNEARHVPVGETVEATISLSRNNRFRTEAGDTDYIIVQERIPAGFRLLDDTLAGNYLAYDLRDNLLTLYYGSLMNLGSLQYSLVAVTPGEYRLPPTHLRSLYQPERFHVNAADRLLTVLPRGAENPDEYRLSPDELYHLGRLHFENGQYDQASKLLARLNEGDWVIRDDYYKEAVRMMLTCALAGGHDDAIVDNFEILKERYPDVVILFDEIVRVGDAYARTGQHERAYLVYRATADGSFSRDAKIGGVLAEQGRFLESVDFLMSLWRACPDTPQVTNLVYAVSQSLYARAPQSQTVRPRKGDEASTVTRESLILEAIDVLNLYLSLYPQSPVADEASYSLANAWLDLDSDRRVIALTDDLIEVFPDSRWLDRFRYMQALAWFRLGEFDKALSLAVQVSESTYKDEQGIVRPSPNKWLALYIAGQIYHAQLDAAKAIEYYEKVKTHFSDAAEAVRLFEQRLIRLPEVTMFHPVDGDYYESEAWEKALRAGGIAGARQAAVKHDTPFVKLDYRNVGEAVVQVYRVDLMKLALAEKNLNRIADVNLAGVKPLVEKTVKLGDDRPFVDKSATIPLELTVSGVNGSASTEGAYLVICRGEDRVASGLVLITPLALEVTEDADAGRARVSVVNALTRSGARDVHVKVIGSAMSRFRTGETDLRGVFIADGVSGQATAIARDSDGHFAFYRNPAATMLAMATGRPASKQMQVQMRQQVDYAKNLADDNRSIQMGNGVWLNDLFQSESKGVQVQQAQ